MFFKSHTLHFGFIGVQIFWPYVTKVWFILSQCFLSTTKLRSASVCSGVFVFTRPSLLEILWTWISTGIAALLKPYTRTQLAVFLPTPGNSKRSSILRGTL